MDIDYGTDRLDDKPQSDIFKTSIFGFVKQIQNFFPDRNVPVAVVPNGVSPLRQLIRQKRTLIEGAFPFFAISVSESTDKTDGYNNFALHRRGVLLKAKSFTALGANKQTQVATVRAHLSAITQNLTVSFITQTEKDIYDFAPRWLDCCRYRYLSFQLYTENDVDTPPGINQATVTTTPDAAIDIRVTGDPSVTYPDLELEDTGAMFTVQASAIMNTYSGVISKQLSIGGGLLNFRLANQDNQPPQQANLEQRSLGAP